MVNKKQHKQLSNFTFALLIVAGGLFLVFLLALFSTTIHGELNNGYGNVFVQINRWPPSSGILIAIISGISVVIFVLYEQNRARERYITSYRKAEEYLILTKNKKFNFESLMCYHRSYNWSLYAGVFLSAALLAAAFSYDIDYYEARNLAFVSCSAMAVGGTIIAVVELVHTNTLTPLVPVNSRFRIVNWCIILGGFGVTVSICAVICFIAILSPFASLAAGISFFVVIFLLTRQRAIPIDEISEAFNLNPDQIAELLKFSAGKLEAKALKRYSIKKQDGA